MTLKIIYWNNLYHAQLEKRTFAKQRILLHYEKKKLARSGVEIADVRYVFHNLRFSYTSKVIFTRPTGWHGESGQALIGGHLTVKFLLGNGRHHSTHHVYAMEESYSLDNN